MLLPASGCSREPWAGWPPDGSFPDETTIADLSATIEAEDQFDLAACACPISAKTLIVAGGRDRFYSSELFDETAAVIPGSMLELFPRRGHVTVTTDRRAQATIAGFLTWPSAKPG